MKDKEKKRCAHCGEKSITNPRAIYCSKSCKTLAWMARKKQEQVNGLSGTAENEEKESAVEPNETPVPFITQAPQAQPQIRKTNSQPTDFPVEDFSFPEQEEIPQQKTSTPTPHNFLTADQKLFSHLDDEPTDDTTGNKIQPFSWNTDNKKIQSANSRNNPAWRNDLPLDQRMAFELTHGIDYDDLFGTYREKQPEQAKMKVEPLNVAPVRSNGTAGWQPQLFTEPEPVQVMPVYDTRKAKRRTARGEKDLKDATENLDRLKRIHYEDSILRTLYNTLSKNPASVLLKWNRLPDEKKLSLVEIWRKRNTLDSLLTDGTGHDIDGHVSLQLRNATAQENIAERNRINKRMTEYKNEWDQRMKKAQELASLLMAQSSWVWVEENYIVNKDECDLYEKNYQAWRTRKKNHEEKQIREREEFIRQQEKIQQLGNIPQVKQTPLPPQLNNAPINNNSQNTINPESKPLQQPKSVLPEKKPFSVNAPLKKSTIGLIVNSHDVHTYAGEMLQLSGRHGKFIGNPPRRFMVVVHGQPGAGKSTYSSQLGKYLADNLGTVIYVSGEEGLSATLEARLIRTDGKSINLYFVDCRSLDDIFKYIHKNKYTVIIIDSLKHLGIDYAGMLELKNHYENESIIFIQQSTKDGKMAGEQALKHEIDIEIIVSGGYAEIGKTRADNSKSGAMFDVFPEEKRTPPDEDIEII